MFHISLWIIVDSSRDVVELPIRRTAAGGFRNNSLQQKFQNTKFSCMEVQTGQFFYLPIYLLSDQVREDCPRLDIVAGLITSSYVTLAACPYLDS